MSRPIKGSQCHRVLERLQSQEVTNCWEFGKMQPAIMNYTARVSQLRKKGKYDIRNHEKRVNGQKHSRYTMEGIPRDESLKYISTEVDKITKGPIVLLDEEQKEFMKEFTQFNGLQDDTIKLDRMQLLKPRNRVEWIIGLIIILINISVIVLGCFMVYVAFK